MPDDVSVSAVVAGGGKTAEKISLSDEAKALAEVVDARTAKQRERIEALEISSEQRSAQAAMMEAAVKESEAAMAEQRLRHAREIKELMDSMPGSGSRSRKASVVGARDEPNGGGATSSRRAESASVQDRCFRC